VGFHIPLLFIDSVAAALSVGKKNGTIIRMDGDDTARNLIRTDYFDHLSRLSLFVQLNAAQIIFFHLSNLLD
jgi:hypothetical protein